MSKITRNKIIDILNKKVFERIDSFLERDLKLITEEERGIFREIMIMEGHVSIFQLAKEIMDQKTDLAKECFEMDLNESCELKLTNHILNNLKNFVLLKDNDEIEHNINSYHYSKDFLFFKEEDMDLLMESIRSNKSIDLDKVKGFIDYSIKKNAEFHRLMGKNKELLTEMGLSNKMRNPFIRTMHKLKNLEKRIELSEVLDLKGNDFIETIINKKYHILFNSRNIKEFNIVRSVFNRFVSEASDFYKQLDDENKKIIAEFIYANKKQAPKGTLEKFIPFFIEHWKELKLNDDKNAQNIFEKVYNQDIRTRGDEQATIIKLLKNLNGKEVYSRVKEYNLKDLSVLIANKLLQTSVSLDNVELSSSVVETRKNKEIIKFVISGDKENVDLFNFDDYLYNLYDASKDIVDINKWTYTDENQRIAKNTMRTILLKQKIEQNQEKRDANIIKNKKKI